MPPRLLSSYPPETISYQQPSPFDKVPDLVVEIARAINTASEIESVLEMLLVEMLGASAEPVAAMIAKIRSASTVRDLILAAAKSVLPQDEMDILGVIVEQIATVVKSRDIFAHQMWDWSPDIDGILFTHKSQARDFSLQMGRLARAGAWESEMKPDRNATTVYERADIAEAREGLDRASLLLILFVSAKRAPPTLRQAWWRLTAQREIQMGLSTLQWSREGQSQKSKPSRLPRERRGRK